MKQPHIQFYTGDWLKDPELSMCSPATRGIWIDMICAIHELQNGGKLVANPQQLSRLCRCSEQESISAINEIRSSRTADVSEQDGVWTIISRRIRKSHEIASKRAEAGSKGAAKTQANREQNPDNDNDNGLERVRGFAKEKGIPIRDADWFYWKGRGNGWTNGGEPIRDWKATLLSWFRAGYTPSTKNGQHEGRKTGGPVAAAGGLKSDRPIHEPTEEERQRQREIIAEEKGKLKL
jgi:hypothetical protein